MAAKLSSCFLGHQWMGSNSDQANQRLVFPFQQRFLPASFKVRPHNVRGVRRGTPASKQLLIVGCSSHHKRQLAPTTSSELPQIDTNLLPDEDEEKKMKNPLTDVIPSLDQDVVTYNGAPDSAKLNPTNDIECSLARVDQNNIAPNAVDENVAPSLSDSNDASHIEETHPVDEPKFLPSNVDDGEKLSNIQLEDLTKMINNAEKNILLLNQARALAVKNMERTVSEKQALQGQINVLEMKLAETDARLKVAAQDKIRAEVLEKQLENLRKEFLARCASKENEDYVNQISDNVSQYEVRKSQDKNFHDLSEDLSSLRLENASLKDNIEVLRAELSNVKMTDDRVMILEKERSHLHSAVRDLEAKLNESKGDLIKLSSLTLEYQSLSDRVENLQALLDKASKQADHAKLVLQQNQDLLEKVHRLEESLKEANGYKLSSKKLLQYNEQMHEKVKLLEERLERSDEEINSYVQLYQESIQEFQDTLNSLKEESKERVTSEPLDNMPLEYWSRLLLLIDGWSLEKKVSADDAEMLREMVWKRDRGICSAYMACKDKNENEAFATLSRLTSTPTSSALHIIHIAAEMAPVAKVGGLGDVVTGLGRALQKKGHLVEIVLPKYDCMQYDYIPDLRSLDTVVESYFDGKLFKNKIWVGTVEGLPVYFIEPLHPSMFFWRGKYYGEHDDFKRFSFFSRAALELLLQAGKRPDIIHCHDWQTAFVAPLYWDIYAPKGMNSARICFTCHNFEYQGTAPASELSSCGLDAHHQNRPDRMQDQSAQDWVNPVKGAVVFSNIVTTVSPTYAQEVRTSEGGRGLHNTLHKHSKKFIGILNGIDTDSWNPATDTFLQVQYSSTDLYGKVENKQALRRQLGLSSMDVGQPLVGCITRLVPQKGIHLIRHAIYRTVELGGQFILLGSSPVDHIQREFEGIANHFQNHDHVRLILKYDESLSHSIYAASDLFIIPSIFEPCGLTQMIAMRYGAIPIARKTGGLNDSVFDLDDDMIPPQFRNGFTFFTPDEQGLNSALDRAIHQYKDNRGSWEQLVAKVMSMDFSWEVSASQYEDLYQKSVARARAARRS